MLTRVARGVGTAGRLLKLGVRSFTSINTNPVPYEWEHITKIDPEDAKKLPLVFPFYLGHTSAISVGGSQDVTSTNTEETFALLDMIDTPVFHEPSAAHHVTEQTRDSSAFLAIPEVLNGHSNALIGRLGEGTEYLRNELIPSEINRKLPWLPSRLERVLADFATSWLMETAVFEAYIIQNVDSAAAREANVTEDDVLSARDGARRALAAEKHLDSPVVYVEYSGTYGGTEAHELLAAIKAEISRPRLWYGGGIASREESRAVLDAGADAVVVGNIFHSIAEEETRLMNEAKAELELSASLVAINRWLADTLDVTETAAYAYLSTIPSVSDPERLGRKYLAKAISVHFILAEHLKKGERLGTDEFVTAIRKKWGISSDDDPLPRDYISILDSFITIEAGDTDQGDADALARHLSGIDIALAEA